MIIIVQAIVNYFGMELVPDIWWGHGYSKDESDLEAHEVIFTNEYKALFTQNRISIPKKIESFHHQGLLAQNVNNDVLEVIATSAEKYADYRIVEYAKHRTLPIVIVQGHPKTFGAC